MGTRSCNCMVQQVPHSQLMTNLDMIIIMTDNESDHSSGQLLK